MQLIRGLHNLRTEHRHCVATIGAFDGIHRGHQAVIARVVDLAKAAGLKSTVVLFEPLPREYFAGSAALPRLTNLAERLQVLSTLGVDQVLCLRFDEALRAMTARQFVTRVFVEGLAIRALVVGDDFKFGKDRAGDYQSMLAFGAEFGFTVNDTATLIQSGERTSSTRIRKALQSGEFELAEALLGRAYSMQGRVIKGQQLGRTIGVPTANVELRRKCSPMAGVYAVEVEGLGHNIVSTGVANVGTRPTIGDLTHAILEVHLFNFDADIYGRKIRVVFRHKLRDERKFESFPLLQAQIMRDLANGMEYFERLRRVVGHDSSHLAT